MLFLLGRVGEVAVQIVNVEFGGQGLEVGGYLFRSKGSHLIVISVTLATAVITEKVLGKF